MLKRLAQIVTIVMMLGVIAMVKELPAQGGYLIAEGNVYCKGYPVVDAEISLDGMVVTKTDKVGHFYIWSDTLVTGRHKICAIEGYVNGMPINRGKCVFVELPNTNIVINY